MFDHPEYQLKKLVDKAEREEQERRWRHEQDQLEAEGRATMPTAPTEWAGSVGAAAGNPSLLMVLAAVVGAPIGAIVGLIWGIANGLPFVQVMLAMVGGAIEGTFVVAAVVIGIIVTIIALVIGVGAGIIGLVIAGIVMLIRLISGYGFTLPF